MKRLIIFTVIIAMLMPSMFSCGSNDYNSNNGSNDATNGTTDSIENNTPETVEDERTKFYNSQLNYSDGEYERSYYKNEWLDFSFIPANWKMYLTVDQYNTVKRNKSAYEKDDNSKKFLMVFFNDDASSYLVQLSAEKLAYENRNVDFQKEADNLISNLRQEFDDVISDINKQSVGFSYYYDIEILNKGDCTLFSQKAYFIQFVSKTITKIGARTIKVESTNQVVFYFVKDGYLLSLLIATPDTSIYNLNDLFECCKNYSGNDSISNYFSAASIQTTEEPTTYQTSEEIFEPVDSITLVDFSVPDSVNSITAYNDCKLSFDNAEHALKIEVTGGDPYFSFRLGSSNEFDGDIYTTLIISYKTSKINNDYGEIFFATNMSENYIENNHISFFFEEAKEYTEFEIDMLWNDNDTWHNKIRYIRIDPCGYEGEGQVYYIKSIKIRSEE